MEGKLKIGDEVIWRGAWGKDVPKQVKITSIEVCNGSSFVKHNLTLKSGISVNEVEWSDIKLNPRNYVFDLNNEHWAYGYQLTQMK